MRTELATIERTFGETKIRQREADGYLDATAMCKATGKQLNHYLSNASTKGVLDFISSDTGIPVSLLVQVQKGVKKGGSADSQGTWVHPRVAMHLAQWVSNEFAAMVTKWVLEIMSKGHVDIRPQQPAPVPAPSADFARLESMVLRPLTQGSEAIIVATLTPNSGKILSCSWHNGYRSPQW